MFSNEAIILLVVLAICVIGALVIQFAYASLKRAISENKANKKAKRARSPSPNSPTQMLKKAVPVNKAPSMEAQFRWEAHS